MLRIHFFVALLLTLLLFLSACQNPQNDVSPMSTSTLISTIYDQYERYKEPSLTHQRFKHADIETLIKALKDQKEVRVTEEGRSFEGRNIYRLSLGQGPLQVLLWSQMHGDEPTATMALFDLLNYLTTDETSDNELKDALLSACTLHIIPMLNPDGAERFQRRTAQGIDMNRDALRLQTPEGRILKRVRDEVQADFAFNLHDQSRYYRSGNSDKSAALSFLAPAFNPEKDVNAQRARAKKVISVMNSWVQQQIPGHVGRYDDTFEPRAFGDNIAKWGSATILIESGGYPNDPDKQFLRKINFGALLVGLESIATKSFQKASIAEYYDIPPNSSAYLQLIIQNLKMPHPTEDYVIDLGFRHQEMELNLATDYYLQAALTDVGDLSTWTAYQDFDATGYHLRAGKNYPERKKLTEWTTESIYEALAEGYTYFPIESTTKQSTQLPGIFYQREEPMRMSEIEPGTNPAFYLTNADEKVRYVVINGFLIDLQAEEKPDLYGLIY